MLSTLCLAKISSTTNSLSTIRTRSQVLGLGRKNRRYLPVDLDPQIWIITAYLVTIQTIKEEEDYQVAITSIMLYRKRTTITQWEAAASILQVRPYSERTLSSWNIRHSSTNSNYSNHRGNSLSILNNITLLPRDTLTRIRTIRGQAMEVLELAATTMKTTWTSSISRWWSKSILQHWPRSTSALWEKINLSL